MMVLRGNSQWCITATEGSGLNCKVRTSVARENVIERGFNLNRSCLLLAFFIVGIVMSGSISAEDLTTRKMDDLNWMEFLEIVPARVKTVILTTGTLEPHGVIKLNLVSPSGMVETPRLAGEEQGRVMWSRETVPTGRAHEARFESASDLDSEVPEEGADGAGGASCARPDPANCDGA